MQGSSRGSLPALPGARDIGRTKRFQIAPQDLVAYTSEITDHIIVGPPGWEKDEEGGMTEQRDTRNVWVVYGRNLRARSAMFAFLRSIDLRPMEWSEVLQYPESSSPYIGEILDTAFSRGQAVVVLVTPDEDVRLKEKYREHGDPLEYEGQSRPNVLFEAGMAIGTAPSRTILVQLGVTRPFSEIAGRFIIRLDDTVSQRQLLAHQLR